MTDTVTAFLDDRRIASGTKEAVIAHVCADPEANPMAVRVHDDTTGRVVDLDYREAPIQPPRGRGRPSLGVTAREVTLLPRHWDWLVAQRGGASAAIRRLVDAASGGVRTLRQRQDAAYAFMQSACGDRPGYEDALRLLYRDDAAGLAAATASWPADIRSYIDRLLAED